MRQFLTILSACIIGSITTTNAQRAHRNTQIASAEVEATNDAPRFIEGLSLNTPTATKNISVKNTVAVKEKVVPAKVEIDEPVPTTKDKKEAAEKIKEGLRKNTSLYSFIQDWYGTPYQMGGTSKKAIDCSAFTRQLLSDVYGKTLDRTAAMQFMMTKRIYDQDDLKEGDLVFFSIHTKRISHVGVYLGNGMFVHASSSRGVMISELSQAYWTRFYAGAGRLN
ncbi:glycoside hydrolase [Taibaiella sp. KBW10]|uniref:C40 family peptidase n=1 Tax=Taibaiella sp. KBW10 TaxID=2153357 RepID=UPI000F592262|nr:C40 family peptidase [Taibaiella sp. KBW10]RQO30475.1 glycoside hydrolase [Taibaiella sp. KBW10]